MVRDLGGWCRQPRQLCLGFLRAFNPIVYSKFIQKYWWLRSPSTNYFFGNNGAWLVTSSGAADRNYVYDNSYGRRSPHTYYSVDACYVTPSGAVDINYVGSFGCLIRWSIPNFIQKYWWLRSPDTDHSGNAYYVRSGGDVIDSNGGVNRSYGRKNRRIHSCIIIICLSM